MKHQMHRHHLSPRAILLTLWLGLLAVAVGAVLVGGHALDARPSPAQPQRRPGAAETTQPTGRRWFFDRSLWSQQAPQP